MGLKIAMITPWMVKCGIYTYSRDLCEAIASKDHEVKIIRLPRFGAKNDDVLELVVNKIPKDVDLIHVQDEYGLYQGLEDGFFQKLRTINKPIVTTMHAVGTYKIDERISFYSDALIVHNEFCEKILGFPSIIIPHGC